MNLDEYEIDFRDEVLRRAEAGGIYAEDAFFDRASEIVMESGETEELSRALYRGARGSGIRIDGHGADPIATGVLDLVICEFSQDERPPRLTATDMNDAFR